MPMISIPSFSALFDSDDDDGGNAMDVDEAPVSKKGSKSSSSAVLSKYAKKAAGLSGASSEWAQLKEEVRD